jgi:hypothetical protein
MVWTTKESWPLPLFSANGEKIKYMCLPCGQTAGQNDNINITNKSFENALSLNI